MADTSQARGRPMLDLAKNIGTWLLRVLIATGALATVYAWVAAHNYNRGWNAHEREAVHEVNRINAAREQLAAELASERLTREARISASVQESLESLHAPVNLVGGRAEPVSSDTIQKLNKIR